MHVYGASPSDLLWTVDRLGQTVSINILDKAGLTRAVPPVPPHRQVASFLCQLGPRGAHHAKVEASLLSTVLNGVCRKEPVTSCTVHTATHCERAPLGTLSGLDYFLD